MSITPEQAMEVFKQADRCFTKAQVDQALDRLAEELTQYYQDKNPLLLCVMNGGLIFTSEILLRLPFALQYAYIHASRYRGKTSGGELNWIAESSIPLHGRHVLVLDDINDEGVTLAAIARHCEVQGAASVRTAVLVEKRHDRKQGPAANYTGLHVVDRYVFGYGMDYKGYLRNMPGIYAVND